MLSKCANPGCPVPFLYLHQGKLFRMDINSEVTATDAIPAARLLARRIEFFWLCNQCAEMVTLSYKKGVGVTAVPLSESQVSSTQASGTQASNTETLAASTS
jgi:hypothetical protein